MAVAGNARADSPPPRNRPDSTGHPATRLKDSEAKPAELNKSFQDEFTAPA